MLASEPDPLIHDPGRLRIAATLAALPDGDTLSVTRLQDMLRLPPGSLSTRLRELHRARYLRTGTWEDHQAAAPGVRAGDADRDAAAAALGEHFAHGRLTLDQLNARLDATLTATTHGELSQAARDLPDLTMLSARVSLPRGKRARPGHQPGPAPGCRRHRLP